MLISLVTVTITLWYFVRNSSAKGSR